MIADWLNRGDCTDSVPFDRWDAHGWETMRRESDGLRKTLAGWQADHDYAMDFGRDVFNLLQKGAPAVRHPLEMDPRRLPIHRVITTLNEVDELTSLREHTVADPFNVALAMVSMRAFLTQMLDLASKMQEQAEAAAQALEEGKVEQTDKLAEDAQEAVAAARGPLRKGLEGAASELEQIEQAVDAFGGSGDMNDMKRMSFAERAALAKRLSGPKLRRFANLIGAWRRLAATEARRRFSEGAEEVVGIKLGQNLVHLTTAETLNLAVPETEEDFWRRWAEGTLLVHELRARERVGRGPILVLSDETGSMAGGGELWAKGLALALLDQARTQGRDFTYLGFGGRGDRLREFTFPAGKAAIADVLDLAEGFLNASSTELTPALARSLELLAGADTRPDVVLITDGLAPVPQNLSDWRTTCQRMSVRSWGIFASAAAVEPQGLNFLSTVADDVRLVTDLLNINQVADILRST